MYVPENLRNNVAFWEIIYQKIPSDQGLFHDADSVRVIYDTMVVGTAYNKARRKAINAREQDVASVLRSLADTPPESRDQRMQDFAALWARELTPDAWREAAGRVRFQLGQRDNFIAGIKRSGSYLERIKATFSEYGLPEELAYLPHVESSFNYRAYSKVGAAGIWQFMRSTGKLYLKVGYVIDERLDPVKSTRAAAKLLSYNYRELGAWPLAVTAYNHGTQSMRRAIQVVGSTDIGEIITAYKDRRFGFASKNFYAEFIAAYRTAINYKAHFGELTINPPFEFIEHTLEKYYKPSALAATFNITFETMREYNLAIRPVVFERDQYLPEDFVIHLPVSLAAKDMDSLLSISVAGSTALEKLPLSEYHQVASGENLSAIAQRYGIALQSLMEINSLDRRGRIFPGQMIALPGGKHAVVAAAEPVVARVQPVEQEAVPPTTPPAATVVATAPEAPRVQETRVVPPLAPDFLRVPRVLSVSYEVINDSLARVYEFMYAAGLSLAAAYAVEECPFCEFSADYYALDYIDQTAADASIRIQIDETIGHLADWSGVSSARIREYNAISSNIGLGQLIKIPIVGDNAVKFRNKRIEYHMSIEEDFFNNYAVTSMDTLTVRRGMNIWTICANNEIPIWLFMKANDMVNGLSLAGRDKVLLPVVESKQPPQ